MKPKVVHTPPPHPVHPVTPVEPTTSDSSGDTAQPTTTAPGSGQSTNATVGTGKLLPKK